MNVENSLAFMLLSMCWKVKVRFLTIKQIGCDLLKEKEKSFRMDNLYILESCTFDMHPCWTFDDTKEFRTSLVENILI